MSEHKSPPPDSVGNLEGRLLNFLMYARMYASIESREGGDPSKIYEQYLTKNASVQQDLLKRLEKIKKGIPITESPSTKPKHKSKVPSDYVDLLEALQNL